jgi:4-hydroxy-2-oxoheptanedioate aldolase
MIALIKQIAQACKINDIAACIHCGTPDYASQAIGWGYQMTTVGGDTRLLAGAASASVAAWRKLNGRDGDTGDDGGMY